MRSAGCYYLHPNGGSEIPSRKVVIVSYDEPSWAIIQAITKGALKAPFYLPSN